MGDVIYLTSATIETSDDTLDTRRHVARPWPDMDVIDGGRMPLRFGEFLVQEGAIDRAQLFRGLQMQDRLAGMALGQCIVALGYLTAGEMESAHDRYTQAVATQALAAEAAATLDIDAALAAIREC
jgi:hypothetical protein